MRKARGIRHVLQRLKQELGAGAFQILDYWDSDLTAVGIAAPHERTKLLYISIWGLPRDRFAMHLDAASGCDSEFPYHTNEKFDNVTIDDVVRLARSYLGIGSA